MGKGEGYSFGSYLALGAAEGPKGIKTLAVMRSVSGRFSGVI